MQKIAATTFVKAWQKADSIEAVMKTLGSKSASGLRTRASNYRKRGILLQKFALKERGSPLDVAMLAKLAKESGPTSAHAKRKTKANKVVKKSKKVKA